MVSGVSLGVSLPCSVNKVSIEIDDNIGDRVTVMYHFSFEHSNAVSSNFTLG
jgi:hypothetical protein